MEILAAIIIIIVIPILLGFLYALLRARLEKLGLALPSFSHYKEKNPQCVDANGSVHCKNCGATGVYVHMKDPKSSRSSKTHICRQCGTRLWWS